MSRGRDRTFANDPNGGGGGAPTKKTKIDVTSELAAETPIFVTSSGAGYTKSGDDGDLKSAANLFNSSFQIDVYRNGIRQEKGVEAVWVSQTQLKIDQIMDAGEQLIIFS